MNLVSGIAALGLVGLGLFYANMQRSNIKDLHSKQVKKDQETDMRNFLLANIDCSNTAQSGCSNSIPMPVQAVSSNNIVLIPQNGKAFRFSGIKYQVRAYCEKKGAGYRVTVTHTPPRGTPIPTFGNLGLGLECGFGASSSASGAGSGVGSGPGAGTSSSSSGAAGAASGSASGTGSGSDGTVGASDASAAGSVGASGSAGDSGSGGVSGSGNDSGSSAGVGGSGVGGSGVGGSGVGGDPCFQANGFYDPTRVLTFETNPVTGTPFLNPAANNAKGVKVSGPASMNTFPSDPTVNPFASYGIAFRSGGNHMAVTWGINRDMIPQDDCASNIDFRNDNKAYTSDSLQCGKDKPNILLSKLAQNFFLSDNQFNSDSLSLNFDILFAGDSTSASGDIIDLDAWEHMEISAFSDYDGTIPVDTTMVHTFYDNVQITQGPAASNTIDCRDCNKKTPRDSGKIIHFQITGAISFKMLRFYGYKGPTRIMEDGAKTNNYGIGFDNFSSSQACPPGL